MTRLPDALSRLEELVARMTAAPWFTLGKPWCPDDHADLAIVAGSPDPHQGTVIADCDLDMEWTDGEDDPRIQEENNAKGIAALRNAAPALLAVARAAQAASAEIQAQKTMWPGEVDTLADALHALAQALGGNGDG